MNLSELLVSPSAGSSDPLNAMATEHSLPRREKDVDTPGDGVETGSGSSDGKNMMLCCCCLHLMKVAFCFDS